MLNIRNVLWIVSLAFVGVNTSYAQIKTVVGDFFNITRTIEQTADSVEFISDTLTLADNAGLTIDFMNRDSVVVTFVQNRFRIVNSFSSGFSDSIIAYVSSPTSMSLRRQAYNYTGPAGNKVLGLKPFFRPAGAIATSSPFHSGPGTILQVFSFQVTTPSSGSDRVSLKRIFFKPNIGHLTHLAVPPDTTKDTLRAYHLRGSNGTVIGSTDLAIVRLLPGTTRMLVWVKDSATIVDAGEFIGSFGDYSRGRDFLGDNLPETPTASSYRPTNPHPVTGGPNPDWGMRVDGGLITGDLYHVLKPMTGGGFYNNPVAGLIPPYRVVANLAHLAGDPEFVTSAVDTLRFLDEYGNRTWDKVTTPNLVALAYDDFGSSPVDRTIYLKNRSGIGDMLRQVGQVVYRRLNYTHADYDNGATKPEDHVRILAKASVSYYDQGGIPRSLQAVGDTSGGFPRTSLRGGVVVEPPRTAFGGNPPASGTKIVVRPNIPRRVGVAFGANKFLVGQSVDVTVIVTDDFGNAVDNNERFKLELSPFSQRMGGRFDSSNVLLDSGRVSVVGTDLGQARRRFWAATGSNNAGYYRVRARASYSFPEKSDLNPGPGFSHAAWIPDGSPNNTFGVQFGPGTPGFGNKMGQTTAIDSAQILASPTMPVELVAFTAFATDDEVLLRWTTESETNNAGFFIERKTNGQLEEIGFVQGNGTTSETSQYSFRDAGAAAVLGSGKQVSYRLRQVDFDGSYEYSFFVNVTGRVPRFSLGRNYPNPFGEHTLANTALTVIPFDLPEPAHVKLEVFDLFGKRVATVIDRRMEAGRHEARFLGWSLPSGVYMYRLEAGAFSATGRMTLAR
ncbi:MAG: hypothetical protein GXO82_04910 [Chlorobi bacterium]|nr:hypothetical protein [Chlorobiota bacterium]